VAVVVPDAGSEVSDPRYPSAPPTGNAIDAAGVEGVEKDANMIPIADDAAYDTALLEALQLGMTDPDPDTPDAVRLVELADALEAYERVKYPDLIPTFGNAVRNPPKSDA
jgi:hypothetical protein